MKTLMRTLLTPMHRKHAVSELRRLECKLPTPHSRFGVPMLFRGRGFFKSIECMQNPYEMEELYHLVCDLCPTTVLEIGSAKGGALYLWMQASDPEATVVSVDLPQGEFGGGYRECRIPLYEAFAKERQKLHLIRADSHHVATKKHVEKIFEDAPIDFLFIDGDHTYEGVKKDFEDYSPLVRRGGIIAFHDILPRPDMPSIQVDRFWKEICKKRKDTQEIIGPEGSGRRFGTGIIVKH